MPTLFEALRESHEVQRTLVRRMTGQGSPETRRAAFLELAYVLDAHATAEERHLYVPLLLDDAGLSVSRHALSDHHEAEKLVDGLRGVDPASDAFGAGAKEISKAVREHLDEEEHGTFQLAGKLLSKTRLTESRRGYLQEYERILGGR
jgi:hypothetical protein